MHERTRHRALISGNVQGVGFRWSTAQRAEDLGLVGWVRNLDDGRVEAEYEGSHDAVARLDEYVHRGPWGAAVEAVAIDEIPLSGGSDFRVRNDLGG